MRQTVTTSKNISTVPLMAICLAACLAILPIVSGCGVTSRTATNAETVSPTWLKGNSAQEKYIAQYYKIAVSERKRTGVPASITLAQGMLESGNGQSLLTVKGNNHFGIKCHDWTGQKIYYDDDKKGECFRKYRTAEESFRDHSDFLRYRDRYKSLFDFKVTDYKSWAYGLKKAGYATDPSYAKKLIKLIEDYELYRFDTDAVPAISTDAAPSQKTAPSKTESKTATPATPAAPTTTVTPLPAATPATPTELETPKPISDRQGKTLHLSLTRQLYSQNGVPFVYSVEGETYSEIARYYNLFLAEILRFNDLESETELLPGTVVYLQPKKGKAARQIDKYVAEGGEELRDIAQRYGVKMKKLLKFNSLETPRTLQEGEMIYLRKTAQNK